MIPRIREALNRALGGLCIALMGAMTLIVIAAVFFRYVFALTTVWTEELITMLFAATTYLGCALATGRGDHIRIDFFPNAPARVRALLAASLSAVAAATHCIVARAALNWISVAGNVPSPGMDVPYGIFYSLIPLCAALVCAYEILNIAENGAVLFRGERSR